MPPRSPTSRDVARLAAVSRTTVSYVLNNNNSTIAISPATRQRVLDAARQLGYHPNAAARSLRRQMAGVVGLVTYDPAERVGGNAFLPLVMDGILSVLGPTGIKLIVDAATPGQPDPCVTLVRGGHVDGLIVTGAQSNNEELRLLYDDGVPIVMWGKVSGNALPFVDIDNVAAARTATEHLISLGHTRIACITNASPAIDMAAADRLAGYRSALESHRITADPRLIRHANFSESSGFDAMRELLTLEERPTAAFVASDEVAIGAVKAAKVHGVNVPALLAVVGFDDLPYAPFVDPSLTTIRVPARDIGSEAARRVIAALGNGRRPPPVEERDGLPRDASAVLETELVIRESSGPFLG
ncbi:MAG TPA: LacI family DNA-binding transcriptional regulator [Candidatus Limnocylindrales bacterium]|nr:LacI family DNA-binding transcriptional regulator [Candidatus Limnocylindrales bacterium]